MNASDFVLSQGDSAAPAILAGNSVVSYGDLRQDVSRMTLRLRRLGLNRGARVGLWAENSLFFVTAYLAVIRLGAIVVPMNSDWDSESAQRVSEDADLVAVLVSSRAAATFARVRTGIRATVLLEHDLEQLAEAGTTNAVSVGCGEELATLMFTSGSTGSPKGVMVSHQNICVNTKDIIEYLGLHASDRAMLVLPMHYCFGLSVLHTQLGAGGSVVLNNQFLYPEVVLQDMIRKECTGFAGVPSTYQILLRKSRFREMTFPRLRWMQQAGGRLPNANILELVEAFPMVRFYTMYGQTEATARLSYLSPQRLCDKLGSIGKGLRSVKLEVLKENGQAVAPGTNEVGEIVASGPSVCCGYWRDPVESGRFFRNGRLHTGDLATVDKDGFIFIVDRERDMIKCGGNRVSAKEIEEVIAELPQVVEAAVIGTPHEWLGEAIMAFIMVTSDSKLVVDDVIQHCRKRLPTFKVPTHVEFLSSLPHNSSGKILKHELRARRP